MSRIIACIAACLAVVCLPDNLMADPIVIFDVENANSNNSGSVSAFPDADVTSSDLFSSNMLFDTINSDGSFLFTDWSTGADGDGSKYYAFEIEPHAGFQITYDNIDLAVVGASFGPDSFQIRTSVDSFAANLVNQSYFGDTSPQIFNDLDITALGTQAGMVEFRFYIDDPSGFGAGLIGPNNSDYGDGINFSVNGTVSSIASVPEPTSLALLGMGACGFFGYGWRRRKRGVEVEL